MELQETTKEEEVSYAMFEGELAKEILLTEGKLYQVHRSVDSFAWAEKEYYVYNDEGVVSFTAMMAPKRRMFK